MEINQLKAFTAIADLKTFEKAAQHLDISEEEISRQISELEQKIGLQLFINTPRRAILTEEGEQIIEGARKILREYNDLLKEILEINGNDQGRLRIGSASAMFATEQLPEILENLKKSFKNAEINVSSGTSHILVERILQGEIDIAFVSLPVENLDIKTDLLFSDEVIAIAHPQHKLAKEKFISAATLAGEHLILGEKGGNTRRMIDDFFERANVKPNVVMELSRQEAIIKMVENDMGVGLAGAKNVARRIREKHLVSWFIEGAEIKWKLGLASLRGGYVSPIAEEFIRLCKENFAEKEKAFKAENKS